MPKRIVNTVTILALLGVFLAFVGAASADRTTTARFLRVQDGDTIELLSGEKIRILGIDAPDYRQCGYRLASYQLSVRLEATIHLIQQTNPYFNWDAMGRRLRYVRDFNRDVGLSMIRRGWAVPTSGPAAFRINRIGEYYRAMRTAQVNKLGIWGALCS